MNYIQCKHEMSAVQSGDLDMLKQLVVNESITKLNEYLTDAISAGHLHIVKFLIEQGADKHLKEYCILPFALDHPPVFEYLLYQSKYSLTALMSCYMTCISPNIKGENTPQAMIMCIIHLTKYMHESKAELYAMLLLIGDLIVVRQLDVAYKYWSDLSMDDETKQAFFQLCEENISEADQTFLKMLAE